MMNLFDFTDYKAYLEHYFQDKKNENPRFSYQLFARKIGFNNRGFIYNIIKGSTRISKSHCIKISKALGNSKNETEYFENIVFYTQAKNEEEKSCFLERALKVRTIKKAEVQCTSKDQYEFYSKWYHSAIRSIIGMFPFKDDYDLLGRKLSPPISALQVKKSVQLLERLGMVIKGEDGSYRLSDKSIRIGSDISQTAKNNFHAECTELAKNAIITTPVESRNVISLTLGISKSTYKVILDETEQFKNRIIEIAAATDTADRVYQYQLILFPLSNDGTAQ
jgi:uncharacterized protein (TIGR02147 family)